MTTVSGGRLLFMGDFTVGAMRTSAGIAPGSVQALLLQPFVDPDGRARSYGRIPFLWVDGGRQLGYTGAYKIAGTTLLQAVPVRRQLFVFPQAAPSLCVASGTSAADGTFEFLHLAAGQYQVLGVDPSGATDSAVHAFVSAVLM